MKNQKDISRRLVLAALCVLGLITAASADKQKKKTAAAPMTDEQVLKDLDTLHQADADSMAMINAAEVHRMERDVLKSHHQALPPVSQEPQHAALEQQHDAFINNYQSIVDSLRVKLAAHADVEKAIRAKQMKLADAAASELKWKSETDAVLSRLQNISDQFAQIGQDYLDIFRDHNTPAPVQANQLINPSQSAR